MRGVVFDGVGAVRVADLPDPDLEAPTDAIVRVTRSAICGSDLHLLHGKAPMEPGEPLGHEAVGVVESVGDGVETRRVGDRVAVAFNVACGHCWFCGIGQSSLCDDDKIFGYGIFGGALPGAQAERLRVPDADVNLMQIPDGVGDEAAVFVGDVLTTGLLRGFADGRRPGRRGRGAGLRSGGLLHDRRSTDPRWRRRSTRSIEIRRGWRSLRPRARSPCTSTSGTP